MTSVGFRRAGFVYRMGQCQWARPSKNRNPSITTRPDDGGKAAAGFVTTGQPNGATAFGDTRALPTALPTPHRVGVLGTRFSTALPTRGWPRVPRVHTGPSAPLPPTLPRAEAPAGRPRGQERVPWAISGWLFQVTAFYPLCHLALMWCAGGSSQG